MDEEKRNELLNPVIELVSSNDANASGCLPQDEHGCYPSCPPCNPCWPDA
ncbi:MAG: hypothetical protein Q4C49_14020 [Bacillota bacterium]|nr:hypothetical protein [Bacillota bacterium]